MCYWHDFFKIILKCYLLFNNDWFLMWNGERVCMFLPQTHIFEVWVASFENSPWTSFPFHFPCPPLPVWCSLLCHIASGFHLTQYHTALKLLVSSTNCPLRWPFPWWQGTILSFSPSYLHFPRTYLTTGHIVMLILNLLLQICTHNLLSQPCGRGSKLLFHFLWNV